MNDLFRKFAAKVSTIVGKPVAFFVAISVTICWAVAGPIFGFSNTWQLFINTGTTIVTLLMVFLIQNTQNRDSRAIHLKLDELIKAIRGARDSMVSLEEMPDKTLKSFMGSFRKSTTNTNASLKEEKHRRSKLTSAWDT